LSSEPIYHIVTEAEFRAQSDGSRYLPAEIAASGFVHCAPAASVLPVANDYYGGVTETLLLLRIDPARLTSPTRYEAADPSPDAGASHLANSAVFPHVYGPIDIAAVEGVGELRRGEGGYEWPGKFVPPGTDWSQAVQDLYDVDDIDRAVRACEVLSELADDSRLPELRSLLQDESFFVREAAAESLARLEGIRALPLLLEALARGKQEGNDNDGLSSTIVDLLISEKKAAAAILLPMLDSADSEARETAVWGLGFVAEEISAAPLLDLFRNDANPRIRAKAAGSLSSFKRDPAIVDALLAGVNDADESVRVCVISALGYLGDERAILPLQGVLPAAEGRTRIFVESSLKRLRGTEDD
jgi:uncharacterized protein (DUF952 family)